MFSFKMTSQSRRTDRAVPQCPLGRGLTRLSQTCCGQQTCRTLLYISNVNSVSDLRQQGRNVRWLQCCRAADIAAKWRSGRADGRTSDCQYSLHFSLICYLDTLGIISHSGLCHTTFATFSNVFTCAMLCIRSTNRGSVSVCLSVTSRCSTKND